MRVLFIDDQYNTCLGLDFYSVIPKLDIPEKLGLEINQSFSPYDLFIININYKTEGVPRSQNAGIDLIKYLRLYQLRQHCILFSFLSREQLLLQDPRNLIIFSPGITFIRLPYDFSTINFEELTINKASEDLSFYFKAESTLPDDRHFFANWWGVLQLWKVQKAIDNITGKPISTKIENSFTSSVKEMNSYQGLIAVYLNREKEKNIEAQLKRLQQQQVERFGDKQRKIESIKDLLDQKLNEFDDRAREIEILNETFYDTGTKTLFQTVLENLKLISVPIENKINQLLEVPKSTEHDVLLLKEYITDEKNRKEEKNKFLNIEISDIIRDIESLDIFSIGEFNIIDARKRLQEVCPKILYVDDHADDGWAFVFQQIIYDGKKDSFKVIQPSKDNSVELISKNVLEEVNDTPPDLIILDLRLKGEHGSTTDTINISGVHVLKRLKQAGISCPVLITTASNKIWSYKETFVLGASAFWIKEGLDEHRDLRSSIENYMRFVDLVYALCLSKEYTSLTKWKAGINKIKNHEGQLWWENNDWVSSEHSYQKTKIPPKEDIILILFQAFNLLEDFLRLNLQESHQISLIDHLPSAIITRLAFVLETIHQTDKPYKTNNGNRSRISLSEKFIDQFRESLDARIDMLDIRNKAVHDQNCTFKEMKDFANQLFEYLDDYHAIIKMKPELDNPVHGEEYISEVDYVDKNYPNRFYLKNPGLNLLNGLSHIILDTRPMYNPKLGTPDIQEGDIIRFNLSLRPPPKINYFALNALKIDKK